MEQEARNRVAELDVKRRSLESEGAAIISELEATPEGGGAPMGIDTPLVDSEGYPRGDVDVVRARTLRTRLNVIRTDHKILMKEVEEALVQLAAFRSPSKAQEEKEELEKRKAVKPTPKFDPKTGKWVVMNWDGTVAGVPGGEKRHFDRLDQDEVVDDASQMVQDTNMTEIPASSVDTAAEPLVPFARINFVSPGSPAAEASMEENDLVLDFGGINHTNHNDLTAIGELVPRAAANNQELEVKILRDGSELWLKLKPSPWHGRGLLGCHIVKY